MSSLPSPGQLLGMPDRYKSWYENQEKAFTDIMAWHSSAARFLGLESPTGSGKSTLSVLLATMSGERTVILTATKGLQAQYLRDYAELGMTTVVGQNNFMCPESAYSRLRCDEGACHEGYACPQKESATCPYHKQLQAAVRSNLVVTNYSYWLAQNRYSSGLGDTSILIADESHLAFAQLESALVIMLPKMETESLGIPFPRFHLDLQSEETPIWGRWKSWAGDVKATASLSCKGLEDSIKELRISGQNVPSSMSRAFRSAKSIVGKLESLSSAKGKWVVQPYSHGWMFTPVWVADYSHLLFRNVPKVMLMSAILSLKTVEKLGVPVWEDTPVDDGIPESDAEKVGTNW